MLPWKQQLPVFLYHLRVAWVERLYLSSANWKWAHYGMVLTLCHGCSSHPCPLTEWNDCSDGSILLWSLQCGESTPSSRSWQQYYYAGEVDVMPWKRHSVFPHQLRTAWAGRLYLFQTWEYAEIHWKWAHTGMVLISTGLYIVVGSYLHFPSQGGMAALMVASYCGHSSVVKALLQGGATVNTTNQVRYSACQILCIMSHWGFYLGGTVCNGVDSRL